MEPVPGLRIEGDGAVLSALRRRGDWLEIRLVNERAGDVPRHAGDAARRGARRRSPRPTGRPLAVSRGRLELDLAPWEIRTVQVR
jgi:hypothetical protein